MTIWRFLVGACYAVPFGAAFRAAATARAGFRGYLLALFVASIIAPGFARSMRLVHRRLIDIFEHSPSTLFRRVSVAMFVAECAWIGAAGSAACWTVAALLHWAH